MLGVAVNNQSGGDGWAKTLIILGVRLRFMVGETRNRCTSTREIRLLSNTSQRLLPALILPY